MNPDAASRRLILLRHGKAVRGQPGERDFDRGLEPRGKTDSEKIGAFLSRRGLVPDCVIVSPAVRTRDTWAHVTLTFPQAPPPRFEPRLYDAKAETILNLVRTAGDPAQVLLVGHNPGLHEVAITLIASGDIESRERLHENLPTAGLVVIGFAVDSWTKVHAQSGRLELFIVPRMLDAAVD